MRDEKVAFILLEYNIIEIFVKTQKTIPKKQLSSQVRNDEYFCIIPLLLLSVSYKTDTQAVHHERVVVQARSCMKDVRTWQGLFSCEA